MNKGQMSFLVKALFIVIASVLFLLVIGYFTYFQEQTTKQKAESNFNIEATNTLQKLVNDGDCLAYVINEMPQKGVIDINKLNSFVSKYTDTEPECAKALDFDYNIKVIQFEKNFTLYPGETCRQVEKMSDFICSDWTGDPFIYIGCNYLPSRCQGVCQACGEFDNAIYQCDPSWGCGDDPLKNCPYTGSCDVRSCPYGKPPSGICCVYKMCPASACEKVISVSTGFHPVCWLPLGKCDLSKCTSLPHINWFCAHCARGIIEVCEPSIELVNVSIPMKTFGFGVGFGISGFSPEKAKATELQVSLPITIKYNETFSAEGVIYIYAVKGELESLSSLLEDFCEKATVTGTSSEFSKVFHFSFPVTYSNGKLCMVNSCKVLTCPYPIDFGNINKEGDYTITFSYDPSQGRILVRK
jgi:hypothetical protein